MRILLLLSLAAGCTGGGSDTDTDSAGIAGFCETLNDGDTWVTAPGGGNASSGQISLRLLTSESADPNDPLYIAFKDFSLENTQAGGVQTIGSTSGDGLVEQQVGAGTWAFRASYTRGSTTCLAEMELPVEGDTTTYGCPVMRCP